MWLGSLTEAQRQALLGLAHNVVVSDGLLDPGEEVMLDAIRREMGVRDGAPSEYLELTGIEHVFDTRRARCVALLNLLHLSYADGAFEIEEECLLRQLARQFGISDTDFLLLDNWVRRLQALEQEAQQFMTAEA